LKRKKLPQDAKARTKEVRTSALRELATSAIRRYIRRMNISVVSRRRRKTSDRQI